MIELYYRTDCPYSKSVRDFIEKNGLEPLIDFEEVEDGTESLEQLKTIAGTSQVPVLVVDGEAIPESEPIIAWLQKHLVDPQTEKSESVELLGI